MIGRSTKRPGIRKLLRVMSITAMQESDGERDVDARYNYEILCLLSWCENGHEDDEWDICE